jgi:phosphonate transport system substrate-binding protein
MFKRIYSFFLISFLMSTSQWNLAFAEEKPKVVIAIQPTSTPEQLAPQAKELENFLEKRLNIEVEIFFPTSYVGVIESLRFGHAHAAFMGAWPATMARSKAEAKVVLAEIREVIIDQDKKDAPYYFSYWVVPKDSVYQTLSELKGKKAAFSSQLSSSGYVAPLSKLIDLGFLSRKEGPVDPKDFFGEVLIAGGYAQAWEVLKAGQVDVTVIAGDVPEKLYREVLDNTRVLEKQGPIPSHVVVVSKDLDEPTKDKLVNALLELNSAEYRDLMRKFVSGIFVRFEPATEEHLQPLEKMLELTGFEFTDKK